MKRAFLWSQYLLCIAALIANVASISAKLVAAGDGPRMTPDIAVTVACGVALAVLVGAWSKELRK